MALSFYISIFLSLVAVAHAYTEFHTKCSIPLESFNFVTSADTRGTLDILWSCLFTIFACTWTVQHLNVPEQRHGRDKGIWGDIWWLLKGPLNSAKWMLVTVIAPELILGKAVADLSAAMDNKREIEKYAKEDGVEWRLAHGFFADMGGFVGTTKPRSKDKGTVTGGSWLIAERAVEGPETSNNGIPTDEKAKIMSLGDKEMPPPASQTQGPGESEKSPSKAEEVLPHIGKTLFAEVPDFISPKIQESGSPNKNSLPVPDEILPSKRHTPENMPTDAEKSDFAREVPIALLGDTLFNLRHRGTLKRLPDVTTAELSDKSKGNIFIKVIAIGQVSWNTTQIIARAAKGLAVTQLELAVAAFSVCTMIIYLILLKKPQGVQVPTRPVDCSRTPAFSVSDSDIKPWILEQNSNRYSFYRNLVFPLLARPELEWDYVPNDTVLKPGEFIMGSLIGCVIFGAPHVAGWNLVFHNDIEQLLWRVASIYTTASPPLITLTSTAFAFIAANLDSQRCFRALSWVVRASTFITVVFYIIARLFLIIEYFRTLFFLPPDAYISTWASNVPHVG